jgi:pimeloyl-ACP methyl ester carboxylesterase
MTMTVDEGKEIRFPVSWGYIAGRSYGDPSGHPVLAIHGWMDNLGSFQPLIPYLLSGTNVHIVAIDEPGCGLSSHKPPGSDYNRWGHVKELKRIIDHLNWKEVSLIGHSLGAAYSLVSLVYHQCIFALLTHSFSVQVFAAVFPELVKRMVLIDLPKPLTSSAESNWAARLPKAIEKHIQYDEMFMKDPTLESTARVYDEAVALKKMMDGHGSSLTEESARILMQRGTKKHGTGVVFTRDIRQKLPSLDPAPTEDVMLRFVSRIRCDLLVIRANQGAYPVPSSVRQKYYSLYERNCRLFRDVPLEGTHHLHMNNPETVGPVINDFLAESFKLQSGFTSSKSTL